MYLSTKNSLLTLLVATTFLTGCQEDTSLTDDTQTSSLAKKIVEETQPIVEETQPIVEETQPIAEETQPIVKETQPIVEETQPIVEETQPIAEETQPIAEETQPIAEETQPIVEETQPIVEETQPIAEETQPIVVMCVEGDAKVEGHVTDKETGAGLPDVQVNVGGCTTATDVNGYFTLSNIAETEKAVVNFEKEGYLFGSTLIQIDHYSEGTTSTSPNYLEYAIDAYDYQWSYNSQTVVSGTHINIPAAVYTDTAGNTYNGTVTAGLKILDVTTDKGKELFPGAFEGKNTNGETVLFGSYDLISLVFKDVSGNALNLADGATATLTFPAIDGLSEQNIIPLWYYDYSQGIWIEEGYAELQSDGTYKGDVSHLGTWSLSVPLEAAPGVYRGRIVYTDNITVKDARVTAIGPNWVRTDLSTDTEGILEIEVLPGDDFQLVAYNYKWKYEASYNGAIPAIASGETVENRM